MTTHYMKRKIRRRQLEALVRKERFRQVKICGITAFSAITVMTNGFPNILVVKADENTNLTNQTQSEVISSIQTGNQFIDAIAPLAASLAAENDLYASVMLAQAFIESGGGTSGLSSAPYYNLFGIKGSYQGNSVMMSTQEQAKDGSYSTIAASFRSYPSFTESLQDYTALLTTDFYQGARKSIAQNYGEATAFLTGRYATSLTYAQTLNSIIELYDLTRFDNATGISSGSATSVDNQQIPNQLATKIYSVQSGDNLTLIAQLYQTTADDLMKLNNLDSDLIHVDQKIVVSLVQRPIVTAIEKASVQEQYYTIVPGDTLSDIAYANQIELSDLMSWNHLTDNLIYAGNQLIIKPVDLKLQNEQKLREAQLALEADYVGEIFNLPQLDQFGYQVSGDLNQYQVDYSSSGQWLASVQKRTFSDSEIASAVNQLKMSEGQEKTLSDGSTVSLEKGTNLSNLSYSEAGLSINVINQSKDDSVAYFENELKAKSLEFKNKINQKVSSDVVVRTNMTKSDASRYSVSWRESNVVYTASAKELSILLSCLPN